MTSPSELFPILVKTLGFFPASPYLHRQKKATADLLPELSGKIPSAVFSVESHIHTNKKQECS